MVLINSKEILNVPEMNIFEGLSNVKLEEGVVVSTPYVEIYIEDGILVGFYKKSLKINLSIAKQIVSLRLRLTNNKPMPMLLMGEGGIDWDKPARDYFCSPASIESVVAAAFVTTSIFEKLIAAFFLKVNSPDIPIKVFSTKEDAMQWLKQYA